MLSTSGSPNVNDDPSGWRFKHCVLGKLLAAGDGDLVGVEQHIVVVHDEVPGERRKQDLLKKIRS